MSVEVRPLGVKCNIQCQYCYQNPQRDAANVLHRYDLGRMMETIEQYGEAFTLFGGEPLLVPMEDLERLWSWGYARFGRNRVQTNGVLIKEEHLRMFKAYRVHVGISVDGPGPLNDVRWVGTLERTRAATEATHNAIRRLCNEGIPPTLILTLHRANGSPDKLPLMFEWLEELERLGVTSARLHLLEVEQGAIRDKYAMTPAENLAMLEAFYDFERNHLTTLRFDLFQEMRRLLLGRDADCSCVWAGCDPYTTRAVQGIEGNGQRSNCGRTNKDGIDFVKADQEGFERYLALYHTPQDYLGCRDCRFFLVCKGNCPGTSVDGDWRNRSEHCDVWMGLYGRLEEEIVESGAIPLSLDPRREEVERTIIQSWTYHKSMSIAWALRLVQEQQSSGSTVEPMEQRSLALEGVK